MKRLFIFLFLACTVIWLFPAAGDFSAGRTGSIIYELQQSSCLPEVQAESALLLNQNNGEILYEKNAFDPMYPASTAKVLTALLAIENGDLGDKITIGDEILSVPLDASKAWLNPGDHFTLKELLYGLMLPSGNDAAAVIAIYTARKISHNDNLPYHEALSLFVGQMNQRALRAGAKDSHFTNPSGYPDRNQYTTAYDLAMITRTAMQDPLFREIVQTSRYSSANGSTWDNTNLLLEPSSPFYFPSATGVKTGHTTEAGCCVIASACREEQHLLAVILRSSEAGVWSDAITLLEFGFAG